jgi:hypothetical protein
MLKTFIASTLILASTMAADPFHKILTSVKDGVHLDTWEAPANTLPEGASIRKITLHGGKQEGVDLIIVSNGKLTFTIIPTRGMSIARVDLGPIRLGWDSPVKETVHPQYINLQSRGGLGWLEGFNEWMVRCGLEFAGHPGKDKFINNTGDEAEMDLTLHGKIGNIPASEVEVLIDPAPSSRIRIRGRVDERMFYGPKLELWTEISTEPNSNTFRIEDQIKNHSAYDQEFQMIYHVNFGPPLLEAGARFIAAAKQVTPFNAHAAKSINTYADYAAPTKGFIEQVYCIRPQADRAGKTTIMLQNAAADKAISMTYKLSELPYLTLWKNTTALEEGYVTGLEPGTGFPMNRRIERHFGRVPKLKPNETRAMSIDYTIHTEKPEIEKVRNEIKTLQGSTQPQLDPTPAPAPAP